ncbi:MAG: hypothetical protein GC137_08555 [Alphaproteobacteria bacterium]|nr:hypothetical protein [Alphaproteobacteria bacterium]
MFKSAILYRMLVRQLLFCAFSLILVPLTVHAQSSDFLPVVTAGNDPHQEIDVTTHDLIRLTPDKSELIRLENEAGSVIVGNPAHVNVLAESSRILVLVPRVPGATHITVLDKKGQVLMQRHVIVASPQKDYVRVRRTCVGDAAECRGTSVYYCPDMCHEINLADGDEEGSNQDEVDSDSDGNSENTSEESPPEENLSEGPP